MRIDVEQIGGQTTYYRHKDRKVLLKVICLAGSREDDRDSWVAIRVTTANGESVDISASPKLTVVKHITKQQPTKGAKKK
jgi:hypothetical protein